MAGPLPLVEWTMTFVVEPSHAVHLDHVQEVAKKSTSVLLSANENVKAVGCPRS
jgi:hypothetical protein